ncbi:hypothetical protein WJX81_006986 [Elliptochloris bilobata]|uniref:Tyrosine specific protein phosphatases domain-containing protein n=1 Tax=Elliptochloris bilobata TaxID=381761 RepID=A0AAW1SLX0_9CHLO
MGGILTYQHEDGMNYARIIDGLIVGSCLQTPADLDKLADEEGVRSIVCLQEDSDMAYFNLDVAPIQARAAERGVEHCRLRIRDFDPFDLRLRLPEAVALVARQAQRGTVYIHCTAGLGRAPATALAYMYWCRGMALGDAISTFMAVRPCNPRIAAIRAATADVLLEGGRRMPVTIAVYRPFTASRFQVAGLDVGWGQQLDMEREVGSGRWVLRRELPPGKFPYKLIVDGRWTCSADHPTFMDGETLNNYVEVAGDCSDPGAAAVRARLLSEEAPLTDTERARLEQRFGVRG